MTLNGIIRDKSSSSIGFSIERKAGVPTQTSQPITVNVNGSGLDSKF
jgi:hypothetical protein